MKKNACALVLFCAMLCASVNCFASSHSDETDVRVKYNGEYFTISTYNENEAVKEIANARKVYAFVVSEVTMDTGNSIDFNETYINTATKEYAVEVWVNAKNYKQHCYVVWSLNGAQIVKSLPEGFEANLTEVGYAGSDTTHAAYCMADNRGLHNSYIVYVK